MWPGGERGDGPLPRARLRLFITDRLIGDPARHGNPLHLHVRSESEQHRAHGGDLDGIGGADDDLTERHRAVQKSERSGTVRT